jgi:hypothetical protein
MLFTAISPDLKLQSPKGFFYCSYVPIITFFVLLFLRTGAWTKARRLGVLSVPGIVGQFYVFDCSLMICTICSSDVFKYLAIVWAQTKLSLRQPF